MRITKYLQYANYMFRFQPQEKQHADEEVASVAGMLKEAIGRWIFHLGDPDVSNKQQLLARNGSQNHHLLQ